MRNVVWIAAMFALGCCTRGKTPVETAGSATPGSPATDKSTVVAVVNGDSITEGDLQATVGAKLRKKEKEMYDVKREGLEELIIKKLVAVEAKKANQTPDDYLNQLIESKIVAPTEIEAKAFYDENKDDIRMPFEEVKSRVIQLLKQEREQKAALEVFKTLRAGAKIEVRLVEPEEPKVEVAATGPSKGPTNAPVTIVEFSDFQCPFCQKAATTVQKVMADYAGQVRLVYRQFPLDFHDKAMKAAQAGMCANEQGKFWEMHDQMFGDQQHLDIDGLKRAARSLGLDGGKFDECLDSGRFEAPIKKDIEEGQKVGVNGTPAFFINGRLLSGAVPYEQFRDAVERELKHKAN